MEINLIRTYAWPSPDSRQNGVVALDMVVLHGGEKRLVSFREKARTLMMFGTDSEVFTTLNFALNGIVFKMAPVLEESCIALKIDRT